MPEPGQQRAAGELADDVAFGRGAVRSSVSPERADVGGVGAGPAAERRGAGDQHVGAGVDGLRRGLGDRCRRRPRAATSRFSLAMRLAIASIFLSWRVDELLPAEARVDAHHQDQVDLLEHIIERLGGRRRVERDAGLLAQRLDALDRAVEVRAGLRDGR